MCVCECVWGELESGAVTVVVVMVGGEGYMCMQREKVGPRQTWAACSLGRSEAQSISWSSPPSPLDLCALRDGMAKLASGNAGTLHPPFSGS